MHNIFVRILLVLLPMGIAPSLCAAPGETCGKIITLDTHRQSTTRYAITYPQNAKSKKGLTTVVLLVGGPGFVNLDGHGCARALTGNSLIRSIPLFNAAGFVTVLADAPSNYHGDDGLGGFRIDAQHADDLGKVIRDVRARTQGPVWVIGTSRGAISAANVASRLTGASAPDGVVLTSAVMVGESGMRKAWVAHSVFDLKLQAIRIPLLVVGHASDQCVRSPANFMHKIAERVSSVRKQVVVVSGGPETSSDGTSVDACVGRSPHGFIGQENDVVRGIGRFIKGGAY